jgi:hypothetical protein
MIALYENWTGMDEDKDIRATELAEKLLLLLDGCWRTFADDQKICPADDEKMAASEWGN